ncbi:hypothetical protein AB0K48_58920 [Nonomuraea sp. NPDC055795]
MAGADVVRRGANEAIACFEKRGDLMWIVKPTPMSWAKAWVKWRSIKRIECVRLRPATSPYSWVRNDDNTPG